MIFKQNVHLTIGLSELPLVNVGDRQLRELCLSAPREGYQGHKICSRILEVCAVGGDWITLALSITSPGTQIIACIEKRGGVVNAVHAYDPYDLTPGVEGRVSYVYFENADEVITVHGFAYGQRYPGEIHVDNIWGDPTPGEPQVVKEFAFLNHRTVKFRDEQSDNIWVGEFTGRLQLPEWALDGTLEGAVPAEVCGLVQETRSVDNVARVLKQDVDHIALRGDVTCTEIQAMATGSVQMTGSIGINSLPQTLPQRSDVQAISNALVNAPQRADMQGISTAMTRELTGLASALQLGLGAIKTALADAPIQVTLVVEATPTLNPAAEGEGLVDAQIPGDARKVGVFRLFPYWQDQKLHIEGAHWALEPETSIYQLISSRLKLNIFATIDGHDGKFGSVDLDLSEPVVAFLGGDTTLESQGEIHLSDGSQADYTCTWAMSANELLMDDFNVIIP
jgi:hypothetical protein